ncbi:TonB family protein [Aggregicoccus sp. 17bor-14]|uniref:energy transducer TonB n=1 Tax=Myxococcaceae TaxID=31 RepID=UPI00129CA586|nr:MULTISPECIES: energy transducer TonB [Myxococcaceae]MBF5045192.1 TonB family protein [Simulacricoccus sp. 17bor-14]MRI90933.1 TonB family protein [Aggregicoccus sp. 17bor-14]
MSAALAHAPDLRAPRRSGSGVLTGLLLTSVALHAGALLLASRAERPAPVLARPVELVVVEVQRPPPAAAPEEKPAPPAPRPRAPRPVKVAEVVRPPPVTAPPPPNDAPPAQPAKAPLVVGISMSSTTTAGTFSAAVGNTAYGKTAERAAAPSDVKAYAAPRYVPVYQVDAPPRVLSEFRPPYPPEARKANVEGTVVLSVTVDTGGRVVAARVVSGPGYGLDEAARDGIRKARFAPAIKGGEPVSTEFKFSYTFLLD